MMASQLETLMVMVAMIAMRRKAITVQYRNH